MKKRIFFICVFFIIIIAIFTISFCIYQHNLNSDTIKNNQIVNINEIEQLIKIGDIDLATSKLDDLATYLRGTNTGFNYTPIIIMASISICSLNEHFSF